MTAARWTALGLALVTVAGCSRWKTAPALPSRHHLALDQLQVFSDTALPKHHRLLEELRTQRSLVSTRLALPQTEEPINVYLFPTSDRLESYLNVHYQSLPKRRAFFVETDTRLNVYAYWGDRVAEDLRHEVAHGYLHAVVPNLPLWLDEGLAEYFEVARGQSGLNRPHLEQLTGNPNWKPDLARLEQLRDSGEMSQIEYAESWAWVHFMLESSPLRLQVLQVYLKSLGRPLGHRPLSESLLSADPQAASNLLNHLSALRQSLQ
jgi:hypothetical protein